MPLCKCGNLAIHQFKNGNWCCNKNHRKCPINKKKYGSPGDKNPMFGKQHSDDTKNKISKMKLGYIPWNKDLKNCHSEKTLKVISERSKGRIPWNKGKTGVYSDETLKQWSIQRKGKSPVNKGITKSIQQIKNDYPFFSTIEEMKYSNTNEIQVHCKNHNCPNSKEQDGWFTPTYIQLYERIRSIEKEYGNDGNYLYCSDECKQECPLFNLQSDPNRDINKQYTNSEYNTWRNEVLKRSEHICEYCGEIATDAHHLRPQKLEPFYSLDPDYGIACCESCHYKHGHKDECSTGKLANKVCS